MVSSRPQLTCRLENDDIIVDDSLRISFRRTIRVPDNVGHTGYLQTVSMANKGGMFFSMYQREAMWINFESKKSPYLVNIYCGGVNAVSGASPMDTFTAKLRQIKIFTESPERDERLRRLQDYIVLPDQPWLDGFATADGIVKQFVAMPFGSGYSVEAQITGQEVAGGLHFEVTPLRDSYQVFLKMINGGTRTFEVGQHTTVDRLRKLIQRSEGIPPKDQRLIYEGVQLKDGRALRSYGLGPNNASGVSIARRRLFT